MNIEKEPKLISDFDRLCEEKRIKGWHYVGQESLFEMKFSIKTGRFEPMQVQTEDGIKAKYQRLFKNQAREVMKEQDFDIEVFSMPQAMLENAPLLERGGQLLVFVRKKGGPK